MRKNIILLIIIMLILPIISLCSCNDRTIYESGDFKYCLVKEKGKKMAAITQLSDSGHKKETIIIPEYIDDYRVYGLYDKGTSNQWANLGNIQKIFITHNIKYKSRSLSGSNVIFLKDGINDMVVKGSYDFTTYIPSNVIPESNNDLFFVYNANVTYYVDGEIYWIDDYDNSLITFIPMDPIKEGYAFDGWYKNLDYTLKWDFSVDTVSQKEFIYKDKHHYDNEKEYIYKEIKLYAKFNSY